MTPVIIMRSGLVPTVASLHQDILSYKDSNDAWVMETQNSHAYVSASVERGGHEVKRIYVGNIRIFVVNEEDLAIRTSARDISAKIPPYAMFATHHQEAQRIKC